MAQQNRRRSRKGGTPGRKGKPAEEEQHHVHGLYESGEEALEEAQVAFGRPDAAERPSPEELTAFEQADEAQAGANQAAAESFGEGGGGSGGGRGGAGGGLVPSAGGGSAQGHSVAAGGRSPSIFTRAVGFVQGSWRELNRVQWPDRRQVFQATGVVLGFVIVAGAFLGLASFVANKIVNLILYGHG